MATHYVQSNTFYLAGSGVVAADTSITLTTFTDIYGNVLTMSDFGAIGYITLEPDTTNEEAAQFTGITANANGTYTLTGVSTLLAVSPYTATSGLVRSHVGGSKVVITDNVGFWNTFGNVNNTNTWADVQTFSVPAVQATNPTLSNQVANKAYVDGVAIAGAPDATTTVKGIGKVSIAPTSPTSPVFVGDNDPRVAPNDYATSTGSANAYVLTLGVAPAALAAGQQYSFKANFANTGAATLNVNSLGAKTIKKLDGATDLVSGDIASGQLVTVRYDGTNFQLESPVALTATYIADYQVFTTNGTWTKPAGLTGTEMVKVQAWGGGGGGGSAISSTGASNAGGGGGGAYVEAVYRASDLGATETVVVGAAAAAGTTGNDTTFGSLITAYGGGAGYSATTSSQTTGGGGGAGGLSKGADGAVSAGGTGGLPGTAAVSTDSSGFGGGGGGTSGNGGNSGSGGGGGGAGRGSSLNPGFSGGNSIYGGGGGGGGGGNSNGAGGSSIYGGSGGAGTSTPNGTATAGTAPGGGGGGSGSGSTNAGTETGGAGARGEVRVWVIRNTISTVA